MSKPYIRGRFLAVRNSRGTYSLCAKQRSLSSPGEFIPGVDGRWAEIDSFDYLSTARLKVRNLHAACCLQGDMIDVNASEERQRQFWDDIKRIRSYIKTGKLRKAIKLRKLK